MLVVVIRIHFILRARHWI